MPNIRRHLATAGIVALAATATASGAAAAPTKPTPPSINGWGHLYAPDGQDREFAFDASGLALAGEETAGIPGTTGTFTVAHYLDHSHRVGVRMRGHVDCLVVGGDTATFTGVIDETVSFGAGAPDISELTGVRRGFSVAHQGHGRPDRLGYSWFLDPGDTTSSQPCQGPAPFSYVDRGGFRLTEWLPPAVKP